MDALSETNLHSHECAKCGTVWRHDPDTIPLWKNIKAHTCPMPGCGETQFNWRCVGEDGQTIDKVPAQFCHNGNRTIPINAETAMAMTKEPEIVRPCNTCRHSIEIGKSTMLRCNNPALLMLGEPFSCSYQRATARPGWLERLFGAEDTCGRDGAYYEPAA